MHVDQAGGAKGPLDKIAYCAMRPPWRELLFSTTTNETENHGNCEENHQAGTCDESRQGQDPGRDGRPSHQGHLHQGCSDQSPGGSVGRRAQGRESRAGRPGNHRARSGQQEGRGRVHAARPAQDRRAEGAVGLAIIAMLYRNTKSVDISIFNKLRG